MSLTLKVKVPAAAACTVIDNTATVTATNDDNTSNNSSSTSTACQAPDVKITKVDTPDPVAAGGTVTYTLSVKNIRLVDASNVSVVDDLSDSTDYISCATTQGSCSYSSSTDVVTATLGTLAPGQIVTITLKVEAPSSYKCYDKIKNTAKVSVPHESNTTNNSATTYTYCKKW